MVLAVRWLPATGLLAAVTLSLTGLISPPPPVAGAPATEIVAYYRAHHIGLEVESLIDATGTMLLVVFAATVHARLQSAASITAFGAACILAACTLVEVAAFEALSYRPDPDPSRAALLNDFQSFAFELTTFPALVFLAASAAAFIASDALPNWLGWAAVAAATLQVVGWVSFFAPTGPLAAGALPDIVSFIALLAWLATASITLLLRGPVENR